MKRRVRISLASVCAVIIVICCLALGLYSFGYMGFEDGKLKFYFDRNADDPDLPDTPDVPDDPSPVEPDEPVVTKYTIHLVLPDKTADYTYYPASGKFTPKAQDTWIADQEKQGKLYRFDNWYIDEFFQTEMKTTELKDGDTIYAKMVEQVEVTIHNIYPDSSDSKQAKRMDKNSIFKLDDVVTSAVAQVLGIYGDSNKTAEITADFQASSSKDIYVYWSTKYSEFEWTTNSDGTVTLTKFKGSSKNVVIPSEYRKNGKIYVVTMVGDSAFRFCTSLTNVIISDTVTTIGGSAFQGCTGLTGVTIPKGVISIENWAFEECSSLTSVIIPDSVTTIRYNVFSGCSNLTDVVIPSSVTSMGDDVFYGCNNLQSRITEGAISYLGNESNPYVYLWKVNDNTQTMYTINSQCIVIGDYAFSDCSNLSSITIPNQVTTISKFAFRNCGNLYSVSIGNGVTRIGYNAFENCTRLNGVYITDLESWLNISFGYISTLNFHTGNPLYYAKKLYLNGTLLTDVIIPDGMEQVNSLTFYYCQNLTSITIPESVTYIFKNAFWNCTSLTSVTINSTTPLSAYDLRIFEGCSSLTSIYVPAESVDAYKAASGWSNYADKIKAIP